MTFKKVLLATAIAAVSTSSYALEAMDDSSMSATTGQDGLIITVTPPAAGIVTDIIWHDTDGYTTRTGAGAVVIDNMTIDADSGIQLDIDASGDVDNVAASNQPGLRIGVSLLGTTTISTGAISVAASNGVGAAVSNQTATILPSMNLTIGSGSLAEIFLGNEENGKSMINLNTTLTGGIDVTSFAVNDIDSSGSISVGTLAIDNAGASGDLGAQIAVDATASGLLVTMTQVGAGSGIDIAMSNVALGSATVMGDVEINGLDLDGTTINIVGK